MDTHYDYPGKNNEVSVAEVSPILEDYHELPEPSSARVASPHNPDETYGRYERPPFRSWNLLPKQDEHGRPVQRQPSRASSLLNRLWQRQNRIEHQLKNGNTRNGEKPKSRGSIFSLAGHLDDDSVQSKVGTRDLGYSNRQRSMPQPKHSLSYPFPRTNRNRWSGKSKQGAKKVRQPTRGQRVNRFEAVNSHNWAHNQITAAPGGYQGPLIRRKPVPLGASRPAAYGRNLTVEDENADSEWIEQVAGGISGPIPIDIEEPLTDFEDVDGDEYLPNRWFPIRRVLREPLAEWLGTMVAVLIGVCGNLQVRTSNGAAGSFTQEAAMWGLGTMMGIYIAGGVSGGHCNPMISIVLSVFRGFPARKCVVYICAQILGAICAVWIAYGIYKDAILNYDPNKTTTTIGSGNAFYTLPASFASPETAFFTDFTSAAIMCGTILALGDATNSPPTAGMNGFIIGLVSFAMAATLGFNTGPQPNPAKDLATRFVPNVVGYGSVMWSKAWWIEAWAAAIFGGITGCLIYDVAIYEGSDSPINYPKIKRKGIKRGTSGKWFSSNMFGKEQGEKPRRDLEYGNLAAMGRRNERTPDGFWS